MVIQVSEREGQEAALVLLRSIDPADEQAARYISFAVLRLERVLAGLETNARPWT